MNSKLKRSVYIIVIVLMQTVLTIHHNWSRGHRLTWLMALMGKWISNCLTRDLLHC